MNQVIDVSDLSDEAIQAIQTLVDLLKERYTTTPVEEEAEQKADSTRPRTA